MITTSIMIAPHLAEYLRGKYNNGADEPIKFLTIRISTMLSGL